MNIVGLDIGGANLKAADGHGRAVQVPFALWKHPERLDDEVRALVRRFGDIDRLAVTMTGELCDCFASKAEGVRHILDSVGRAVPHVPLRIWTTDGDFRGRGQIEPLRAAAANWLALATFAGRYLPHGNGLVIDLGSTTCDFISLKDGRPQPVGRTDPARLRSGELVYCGVRRTPLCAVFGLTKAAEWFATTEDVYVVLGDLPEDPGRSDSADNRPITKAHAAARLARMECDEAWTRERTLAFAGQARDLQVGRLAEGVAQRTSGSLDGIVLAGAGEFLLPRVLAAAGLGGVRTISLAAELGPALSTAACAHAVAVLAAEEP
jgi:probable H4MPT-linked C1 transfer pathway protein